MPKARKLGLRKETLARLGTVELAAVAGAQEFSGKTCPVRDCLGDTVGNACASILEPCISWGTCTTY